MPVTDTVEPRPTPTVLIERLERLLRVEEIATDLYRGLRTPAAQGPPPIPI